MSKKRKNVPIHSKNNNTSYLYWGITFITFCFLFISPFHNALFNGRVHNFEGPIYSASIWSSVLLLLLGIHLFKLWKDEDQRHVVAIYVWLIPLMFLISWFTAASSHYAYKSIYINIINVTFFLVGIYLAKQPQGIRLIKWGLLGSGYVVVLFGFMNLFGDASFFGMFQYGANDASSTYIDAVRSESRGIRLTSVFQYANTYAAYLIGLLFASLVAVVTSRRWYTIVISAVMLVPILTSIILTSSRGGLLVIPIIFVLLLPLINLSRQILLSIHLAIAAIGSVLIMNSMNTIGLEQYSSFSPTLYVKGWGILIAASLVSALLSFVLQKYSADGLQRVLEQRIRFRFSFLILPVLAVVIGIAGIVALFGNTGVINVLPENIQQRVENINLQQHSVLERATFYSNSLEMITDHPIIGTGGDGWASLYQKYQTNPYTSSQAHNYYLQILIDIGIVGFIIFALLFIVILFLYIKGHYKQAFKQSDEYLVFFITALSILVHSAIDFNMSYVYISLLVFLCLGVLSSASTLDSSTVWTKIRGKRWMSLYPTIIVLLAIVVFFGSVRLYQAHQLNMAALQQLDHEAIYHEIVEPLDRAIDLSPNPQYMNLKLSLLNQAYTQTGDEGYMNETLQLLQDGRQKEPYDRALLEHEYSLHLSVGDYSQALDIVTEGINDFPWDMSLYEQAIVLNYELGSTFNDPHNEYWDQATQLYNVVESKIESLALLSDEQFQGRKFEITQQMNEIIDYIQQSRNN